MPEIVIITCEHAGNEVPSEYQALFTSREDILASHRGWDLGAFEIASSLSSACRAPLYFTTVSRLLVEANRSVTHPDLFSEFTNRLSKSKKEEILSKYWKPYRQRVEHAIQVEIENGNRVLHLSIHTFTPIWKGVTREVELGILYDPDRASELAWAHDFSSRISVVEPTLVVRHNEPYLGKDDGFTTYLRACFNASDYIGIELEINQKFVENTLPQISQLIYKTIQLGG